MMCKGLGAKMIHAIVGGTLFYVTMNQVEKMFDVNLSEGME